MSDTDASTPAAPPRHAWLAPAAALALAALAYRPLLATALELPTAYQIEQWLFRPSQLPLVFVMGVAGWLAWRRRGRLRALPRCCAPLSAVALAALGTAAFAWALLTRATDLLLPSLAASGLALASARRGRAGARALALPAAALCLGIPLPAPLRHEIVWRLQLAAASGSGWLLDRFDLGFAQSGVILHAAEQSFHVIDGCSGLQGIAILVFTALVVRELLADSRRRQWLLVGVAAPLLGYALNAVRVASIAASADPEALLGAGGDHTPQGLAVLAAGTAALYALGWALARVGAARPVTNRERPPPARTATPALPWSLAAAWLAALGVLSFALPPFPKPKPRDAPSTLRFPTGGDGWTSERISADPLFYGVLPGNQSLHRAYEHSGGAALQPVEMLVAYEDGPVDIGPLLSSKIRWPDPEWEIESASRTRLWMLDREADYAVAARPGTSERAVVYSWRPRDAGLLRESGWALLALDATPLRRERGRAVVRLLSASRFDESLALARAKQRLDRFVAAFRADLEAL